MPRSKQELLKIWDLATIGMPVPIMPCEDSLLEEALRERSKMDNKKPWDKLRQPSAKPPMGPGGFLIPGGSFTVQLEYVRPSISKVVIGDATLVFNVAELHCLSEFFTKLADQMESM